MKRYILALDQGTSSSRAVLFDGNTKWVGMAQSEIKQIFPKPGWVEHDPMQIVHEMEGLIYDVIKNAKINIKEISAIGITNQRETIVVWDKSSGKHGLQMFALS